MRRRQALLMFVLLAVVLGFAAFLWLRPHPIVGHWKLELPANSPGTGERLILLSDGTGDLDGNAFHYKVVDGENVVVTYPPGQVYVWPFHLSGNRLTLTYFKETHDFI